MHNRCRQLLLKSPARTTLLTGESTAVASGRPAVATPVRSVDVTKSAVAWASRAAGAPAQAHPSAASTAGRGTPSCASAMYTTDSHLRITNVRS